MATSRTRPGARPSRARRPLETEHVATPALALADVEGHAPAIDFLRRAWTNGRLAQAYVFTGPAGIGKYAVARALAAGVHCDATPFDGCGTCPSCHNAAAGSHPDVRTLAGPAKNRRDVSIDQVRELQRELGFRSVSAHPKVGIVNDADLLTVQAQNALLKTLEEPSGDSLLLLIAVNATSLLPTILSRCQRLAFRPLTTDVVARILQRHGCGREEAATLAAYADGSPGRALALDREFFVRRRPQILERLVALRPGDARAALAVAQELAGGADDPAAVLGVLASWQRDVLRRAALGADVPIQNADLAAKLPPARVEAALRQLEATYATILALRQNANRNLAFADLLMRLTA